jgi:hypothetical protein
VTGKTTMGKREKNFRWMRSSLQTSVEVMELNATGPNSNLGLDNVQLNIRILYKQEKKSLFSESNPTT